MRRLTRRQRLATLVLAALAGCLLALDLGGGGFASAHSGVRGSLGALYRGTDSLFGPVRRFVAAVPSAGHDQGTIDGLRRQVAQLQNELNAHAADATTAAQLHQLQLAANGVGAPILPARVLALGAADGFDWTVTIDAGTADGVAVGQSVTDGYGLVGRVLHADRSTSVVLLAADPGAGVGVRDVRSGEIGLATGQGVSGMRFVPLNPAASVRAGDALVTGPAGATVFVPGLAVGRVTSVRRSSVGAVSAQVRAATSPTRLDLVGVIVGGSAPSDAAASGGRDALQPGPTGGN
jgi:rod shape-determining protein MreC